MRRLFALLLVFTLWIGFAPTASADVAGLTPCSQSAAFKQRAQTSVSATAAKRFDFYAKSGLLCGEDGLPHLIVDGRFSHAGEFTIPSLLFLFIAGWIGWVGRSYLQAIKKGDSPEEKEVIIDVPLAIKCMLTGFAWPLAALKELASGELTAKDSEIPVSPR
ncbi:Photosystem I reaction center subunit III [Neosynechococcus sphagnicola sy1]|uniref:Photosystem I reaction center subunit III n=1 Tax=Neosynechococcus sphagnicola sy1 TaxID=1497020 RepID=A0A098TMS6_9CYAN|nr:photosystem I reaction center subunit III [Neosynechococcus sphagnicola]KGF73625.1 Photosystem I reaction center subunit III [Neosynechococcus sphagnicola sy1]